MIAREVQNFSITSQLLEVIHSHNPASRMSILGINQTMSTTEAD